MKLLKQLGLLLLVAALVTFILSIILPASQKIERSVTIAAPPEKVYAFLARLDDFNKFSVWSQRDPIVKNTITGKDGEPGSYNTWVGDPNVSGEGKMTIISVEPGKSITHKIDFLSPRKSSAESSFLLSEENGSTLVTWRFSMKTPRPWNVFNLMRSMNKELGPDFEEGLNTLKNMAEGRSTTVEQNTGEINKQNLESISLATIRQQVNLDDMDVFFTRHWLLLKEEIKLNNATAGKFYGLVYSWDEKTRIADIAAAAEVKAGTKMDGLLIRVEDFPASKAVFMNNRDSTNDFTRQFQLLRAYIIENGLKEKWPVFLSFTEKDSTMLLNRLFMRVE